MDHYFIKSHLLLTTAFKGVLYKVFCFICLICTAKLGGFQHQHVLSRTVGWEPESG